MNANTVDSVHDLIFITDYFTPGKTNFKTVTNMLDKLHIFWFQGPKDGRVYVTRDAILWIYGEAVMDSDYLTKVDENKRVWGFKKLVIARTKMIPLLLLLVFVPLSNVIPRPLPIAYEMLKGWFCNVCYKHASKI